MSGNNTLQAELIAIVDELHLKLVYAAMEFGLKRYTDKDPTQARKKRKGEAFSAYDKAILETEVAMTLLLEWWLRGLIKRYESQSSFTAEEMTGLAKEVSTLSTRVQFLYMIAELKPALKAYHLSVRNSANFATKRNRAGRLKQVLCALAEHPALCIRELAELYEIENLPVEVVDYFLEPDKDGNDRSLWLRRELGERGHYAGRRGRPRTHTQPVR